MAKKQLNTTGSKIKKFDLDVRQFKENNIEFRKLYLAIYVDDNVGVYEYEICEDSRFTIDYLVNEIPKELNFAMGNLNKVTISEYSERFYVFFHVHDKDFKQMQLTARRQ